MIATLGSMERLTGTKMVCEFEQGFTDDWDIHLQVDDLKELETVNASHENVTDNHVKLVIPALPLPEHVQRTSAVSASVTVVTVTRIPTKKRKAQKRKSSSGLDLQSIDNNGTREITASKKAKMLTAVVVAKL